LNEGAKKQSAMHASDWQPAATVTVMQLLGYCFQLVVL